jgi:hypothetical protein
VGQAFPPGGKLKFLTYAPAQNKLDYDWLVISPIRPILSNQKAISHDKSYLTGHLFSGVTPKANQLGGG